MSLAGGAFGASVDFMTSPREQSANPKAEVDRVAEVPWLVMSPPEEIPTVPEAEAMGAVGSPRWSLKSASSEATTGLGKIGSNDNLLCTDGSLGDAML